MQTVFLWTLIARQISQSERAAIQNQVHDRSLGSSSFKVGNGDELQRNQPLSALDLSPEQNIMIREVFNLFDTDGEGQLDEAELASAIFTMGFSSHNHVEMAAKFMDRMDTDGNRRVSIDEFIQLMQGQLAGRDPEEEIRSTYAAFFGIDRKGTITLSLLREMTMGLGISLSDDELCDMIKDADRNGEGGVDEEEFVHILKHSTWI